VVAVVGRFIRVERSIVVAGQVAAQDGSVGRWPPFAELGLASRKSAIDGQARHQPETRGAISRAAIRPVGAGRDPDPMHEYIEASSSLKSILQIGERVRPVRPAVGPCRPLIHKERHIAGVSSLVAIGVRLIRVRGKRAVVIAGLQLAPRAGLVP